MHCRPGVAHGVGTALTGTKFVGENRTRFQTVKTATRRDTREKRKNDLSRTTVLRILHTRAHTVRSLGERAADKRNGLEPTDKTAAPATESPSNGKALFRTRPLPLVAGPSSHPPIIVPRTRFNRFCASRSRNSGASLHRAGFAYVCADCIHTCTRDCRPSAVHTRDDEATNVRVSFALRFCRNAARSADRWTDR